MSSEPNEPNEHAAPTDGRAPHDDGRARDARPRVRTERGIGARATGAEVTGASATGVAVRAGGALGSMALGAMALGALAVGAVAIGRLVVKRAVVEHLRALGKDVEYLLFENEGHDVLKLENRIRCYNAITDFFVKHLKP